MRPVLAWTPAALFAVGAVFTVGVDLQRVLPLRQSLGEAIPMEIGGAVGTDIRLSDAEVRVAGVTDYLMRSYQSRDSAVPPRDSAAFVALPFSVYVGYYDSQMQGKTIHSPKNCLPGAGWEALASTQVEIPGPDGPVPVNRYLLQNGEAQALVLYWYQGRGRVESNEYVVKWNLLRDSAIRQRSDEALVRIVVPIQGDEGEALTLAVSVAEDLLPAVVNALPE
jgi:EpsI family protein